MAQSIAASSTIPSARLSAPGASSSDAPSSRIASRSASHTGLVAWARLAIIAGLSVCALALMALAALPDISQANQGGLHAEQVLAFPGSP